MTDGRQYQAGEKTEDALAALDALNSWADARAEQSGDPALAHSNIGMWARTIRQALTASGVPEEVRWLPEEIRQVADGDDPPLDEMPRSLLNTVAGKIERALDTPPPEGEPCHVCGEKPEDLKWCDGPFCWCPARPREQAHGDALAALDRAEDVLSRAAPGDYDAYLQDDCEIIRRRLTASGVPEEVLRLPEKLRALIAQQVWGAAKDAFEISAQKVEAALASAPADGYKLVPVEPTIAMAEAADRAVNDQPEDWSRKGFHGDDNVIAYKAMIAAAPTDGMDYE